MAKLNLSGGDEAQPKPSAAAAPSTPSSAPPAAPPTTVSPPSMLSQRVLANMSPSERPKAKPSRKGDGKAGKKGTAAAAAAAAAAVQQLGGPAAQQQQQQTHPLQQLAHLKQMNQRLHQQVQQQKKMKPTENQVGIKTERVFA